MTACPLNGNCVYNHQKDASANFCGRSNCAYPELQRKSLVKAIVRLRNFKELTEEQEKQLRRYRMYLKKII